MKLYIITCFIEICFELREKNLRSIPASKEWYKFRNCGQKSTKYNGVSLPNIPTHFVPYMETIRIKNDAWPWFVYGPARHKPDCTYGQHLVTRVLVFLLQFASLTATKCPPMLALQINLNTNCSHLSITWSEHVEDTELLHTLPSSFSSNQYHHLHTYFF